MPTTRETILAALHARLQSLGYLIDRPEGAAEIHRPVDTCLAIEAAAEFTTKMPHQMDVGSGEAEDRLPVVTNSKDADKGRNSLDAAALVWSNAPVIIGAHDTGPLIRSSNGFWLAIPLPAAGKALGGKRITPAMWEKKTGLRLRFVYRSRGPSLLVADAVRLNTRGQAAVSKSKTGKGQVTAPIFLLVRQVKLPKRLDLARDAERALAAIPGSIVRN